MNPISAASLFYNLWQNLPGGHDSNRSIGGTPIKDRGVTEQIGDVLGISRDANQGSQIFGSNSNASTNTNNQNNGGEIQGPPGNPNKNTGGNTNTGGGNTGGTVNNGGGNDSVFAEIENIFSNSMNHLNNLENTLRGNQGSINNQINQNYDTSRGTLTNTKDNSMSQIDLSQRQGEQRKLDAITAARNLYNELVTGGQQRFGGASSAGEAYQALAGREMMRNNQQTQTDFNAFMGQIAQAKSNLEVQYNNAMATLEQQKNDALAQAQREFNDKLAQINGLRNEAASQKAQARLSAISDLRNQIFQINLQNAQNSQAVQRYAMQISDQLNSYESSASSDTQAALSGQQTFGQQTSTNPTTALTMGNNNQRGVPQQYIGMINNPNDREQEMVGSINPYMEQRDRQNVPFAFTA